jgi:ABC-2 type transport system ATP-binding protein
MTEIIVENLVKDFTCTVKKTGFSGAIANVLHPQKQVIHAVDSISYAVSAGEIVGFIGPNGAGKSTTVKMMTGILHPTSGLVRINGLSPHKDRMTVARQIGVVFGQRSQLYWDLRLGESFELLRRIYQVDAIAFQDKMKRLDSVLQLKEFMNTPVRQLSLGQRMRGDLAASMIHSPAILFLDEPTIGLDIIAKKAVRQFIKEINDLEGTTVILTTHDLADVEELCSRLVVINHGKIIEDGQLQTLLERMTPYRYLVVEMQGSMICIDHPLAKLVRMENHRAWFRFENNQIDAATLITDLMKTYLIKDIRIDEPDIEELIVTLYGISIKEQ